MEAYSKCCTCIGGYRDGPAVQINDFFDNRETQSVSLRGMGRVCLIELVKNMGLRRRFDAHSLDGNRNARMQGIL